MITYFFFFFVGFTKKAKLFRGRYVLRFEVLKAFAFSLKETGNDGRTDSLIGYAQSPNHSDDPVFTFFRSSAEAAQNEKTEGNTSNEAIQAQKLTAFNYVVPLAAIPPGGVNGSRPTANLGVSYWGGPSSSLTMQGGNMASTTTAVPSNHNVPIDPVIQVF